MPPQGTRIGAFGPELNDIHQAKDGPGSHDATVRLNIRPTWRSDVGRTPS
jgi:hypothetical protein